MKEWSPLLPLGVAVASAGSFVSVMPTIGMVGVKVTWNWWPMAEEVPPEAI